MAQAGLTVTAICDVFGPRLSPTQFGISFSEVHPDQLLRN